MDNNTGNRNGMGPGNNVAPTGNTPPNRVRRTHTDPEMIETLKNLPLYNKLLTNKNIEQANFTRSQCTIGHRNNPRTQPHPSSNHASLITIDKDEALILLDDSVHKKYADVLSVQVTTWLAAVKNTLTDMTPNPSKRASSDSTEKSSSKPRCMKGDNIVPCTVGKVDNINFPKIMFETEFSVPIVLPLFLPEHLKYINTNIGCIPTVKANPTNRAQKGNQIINVEKLTSQLNCKELLLSCSHHTCKNSTR